MNFVFLLTFKKMSESEYVISIKTLKNPDFSAFTDYFQPYRTEMDENVFTFSVSQKFGSIYLLLFIIELFREITRDDFISITGKYKCDQENRLVTVTPSEPRDLGILSEVQAYLKRRQERLDIPEKLLQSSFEAIKELTGHDPSEYIRNNCDKIEYDRVDKILQYNEKYNMYARSVLYFFSTLKK